MRAKYYAGHTALFVSARALFFCMTGVLELDLMLCANSISNARANYIRRGHFTLVFF
jgi:hypothetical protein